MSETYSPSGTASSTALLRPTSGEATGSFGTDQRTTVTEIAERTRYLANDGTVSQDAFTTPTLVNGWSNLGGTTANVGYYKGRDGVVRLRGAITGGTATASTSLFTLPSGYRPPGFQNFAVVSNGAFCHVSVGASGDVAVQGGGNAAYIALDTVAFKV